MNRWSALLMRKQGWEYRHIAGDLHAAYSAHLTPQEMHGQNLISTLGKYVGKSPDPNDAIFTGNTKTKEEREGLYLVTCWCGRNYLHLERHLIGKTTLSCGRAGCSEGGVPRCENCGKPVIVKDTEVNKMGRKKNYRWCSQSCRQMGYKKLKVERGGEPPLRAVFEWKEPPLTEVEQYDREIERLSAEIKQLQGEGHDTD